MRVGPGGSGEKANESLVLPQAGDSREMKPMRLGDSGPRPPRWWETTVFTALRMWDGRRVPSHLPSEYE